MYPLYFYPTTRIQFAIPESDHVHLAVYNVVGQRVAILVNENKNAGWHDVSFDASGLSNGMLIYRIEAGNHVETRHMMLVK